ncbi:MAG TPA: hypothetical protein VMS38_02140 [Pseudorhodoferax sp.]|jgi:hypothetical protein|nr:hypothetical protein [Pseudorhodoferax sp.]
MSTVVSSWVRARGRLGLPRRLLGLAIAVGGLGLLAGRALAPWLG